MKRSKKVLSFFLALVLCLSMAMPTFAAEVPGAQSEVTEAEWTAEDFPNPVRKK